MGYFDGQSWERDGDAYRMLGIRRVRGLVAGGRFWTRLHARWSGRLRRPTWTRSNVRAYVRQSIAAEVAHSTSFLILLAGAVHLGIGGLWLDASLLLTANVGINLVPIGVLRYNRLRLQARLARRGVDLRTADRVQRLA